MRAEVIFWGGHSGFCGMQGLYAVLKGAAVQHHQRIGFQIQTPLCVRKFRMKSDVQSRKDALQWL